MFVVYCPTHGSDVMLGIRRVRGATNVRGLIVLVIGHRARTILGRPARIRRRRG